MALIWFEGFDYLPTATTPGSLLASLGIYDLNSVRIAASGRFGGNAIVATAGAGGYFTRSFNATYQSGFLGFARTGSVGDVIKFVDLINDPVQCSVRLSDFGIIQADTGDYEAGGTLIGSSSGNTWVPGIWAYYEIGPSISTSTGSIVVRVNGRTVLTVSSVATQISPLASFGGVKWHGIVGDVQWDDFYFNDSTGSAPYNTFLGNVRVRSLAPSGAGDYTQLTPYGAATNWQAASNGNVDDTSYVYGATTGLKDGYTMGPSIPNVTIFGVQTKLAARQTDATDRSVLCRLVSGSTESDGASTPTNEGYAYVTTLYPTDPNTSAAWTYSGVNAVIVGPKIAA